MMIWPGHWPASASRRPSPVDVVVSRVRHPSFTPEGVGDLVRALSRRQLRRLWSETSRLLSQELSDAIRLNVVLLRDQVLRELERHDVAALRDCARTGRPRAVRRRRAGRS
jgi:hypothetical protein